MVSVKLVRNSQYVDQQSNSDMNRFTFKKLNYVLLNSNRLKFEIGLKLCQSEMVIQKTKEFGEHSRDI